MASRGHLQSANIQPHKKTQGPDGMAATGNLRCIKFHVVLARRYGAGRLSGALNHHFPIFSNVKCPSRKSTGTVSLGA